MSAAGGGRRRPGGPVAMVRGQLATGLTVVGTVLIVLGLLRALVVLEVLGETATEILVAGWPAVIVGAGLWWLASGRRLSGLATVLVGVVLLALTASPAGLTLPVLLIAVGLVVLAGALGGQRWVLGGGSVALFGDVDRAQGADRSYVAVFGTSRGRLTEDHVGDGHVECLAVFGDVEVQVPADVEVILTETAVFGDVRAPTAPTGPVRAQVAVRATAVFGDVRLVRP